MDETIERFIKTIEDVAKGHYTNDIMEFTGPGYSEIVQRIAEAMGMMMVKVEIREHRLETLVAQLKQTNRALKSTIIETASAIANALGARDIYTEGHAERVGEYSVRLATRLGLEGSLLESVGLGGLLHDVGKIGFSDRLFNDTDPRLSPQMIKEIRRHPQIGADIIKDLDFLGPVSEYVLYHHERLDGSGYPFGLKGSEIPLGAQIIAVADCFDAATTDRNYASKKSLKEGIGRMRSLIPGLSANLVELMIEDVLEHGIIEKPSDLDPRPLSRTGPRPTSDLQFLQVR